MSKNTGRQLAARIRRCEAGEARIAAFDWEAFLEAQKPVDRSHLRAARMRAGISQKDLGERVGVSASIISEIERGRRGDPNGVAERMARDLDEATR